MTPWVNQTITTMDNGDFEIIMVIADRQRFQREDLGGAIYFLPKINFSYKAYKGLGIYEWTSYQAVKPILQINFKSALEAMQLFGVKVYFK